jgi:hypothetical protein
MVRRPAKPRVRANARALVKRRPMNEISRSVLHAGVT